MPACEGDSSIIIVLIEKLSYKGQAHIEVKCRLESVSILQPFAVHFSCKQQNSQLSRQAWFYRFVKVERH